MLCSVLTFLCLLSFITSAPKRANSGRLSKQHCVATNSYSKRVMKTDYCTSDVCGRWDMSKNEWEPLLCKYRDVTVEQARKCMSSKTIACVGDSQIRDTCVGLGLLLGNISVSEAANDKHGKSTNSNPYLRVFASKLGPFDQLWRIIKQDGILFPNQESKRSDQTYQVQIYSMLYNSDLIQLGLDDVVSNRATEMFNLQRERQQKRVFLGHRVGNKTYNTIDPSVQGEQPVHLNSIDLVLWNHGLHDFNKLYSQFLHNNKKSDTESTDSDNATNSDTAFSEYFYSQTAAHYNGARMNSRAVPMVWVSMNNQCVNESIYSALLKEHNATTDTAGGKLGSIASSRHHAILNRNRAGSSSSGSDFPSLEQMRMQAEQVNRINLYVQTKFKQEKVPYWDAASVTKSAQRCDVTAAVRDVVHLPVWMEIVRAKILLNYLCDEQFNWVGMPSRFVQ